jgi:hypothetical protein
MDWKLPYWRDEDNMFEGKKLCIKVSGDHFLGIDRVEY